MNLSIEFIGPIDIPEVPLGHRAREQRWSDIVCWSDLLAGRLRSQAATDSDGWRVTRPPGSPSADYTWDANVRATIQYPTHVCTLERTLDRCWRDRDIALTLQRIQLVVHDSGIGVVVATGRSVEPLPQSVNAIGSAIEGFQGWAREQMRSELGTVVGALTLPEEESPLLGDPTFLHPLLVFSDEELPPFEWFNPLVAATSRQPFESVTEAPGVFMYTGSGHSLLAAKKDALHLDLYIDSLRRIQLYYQYYWYAVVRQDNSLLELWRRTMDSLSGGSTPPTQSAEIDRFVTAARDLAFRKDEYVSRFSPLELAIWDRKVHSWLVPRIESNVEAKTTLLRDVLERRRLDRANELARRTGVVVTVLTIVALLQTVVAVAAFVSPSLGDTARIALVLASFTSGCAAAIYAFRIRSDAERSADPRHV